jgi:probable phosphoglycerate mutase
MILYLIRHGQTNWNREGKIQGSNDIELNKTGILQAEELSRNILSSDIRFSKIYTSRQKRALKTALILSIATSVDYIPIDGLEEINLGEWEGLTWDEVKMIYPAEFDSWLNNRRYQKPPKGESYQEMLERALAAIHKIINNNTGDIAIITHSAVIMCLQCYVTNTPFSDMLKFRTANTDIVRIDSTLLQDRPNH